jgi:adenine-specific DNA-methyltransferase
MSRFIQGNCVHIMSGFPDNAVDFILTDPPYLVGFRDRQGRTIAGDKTDEWLQPACHEMYRVLKKDALMVSFYGWNRVDRFMAAWCLPKPTHRRPHMWAIATSAPTSLQKAVRSCRKTR